MTPRHEVTVVVIDGTVTETLLTLSDVDRITVVGDTVVTSTGLRVRMATARIAERLADAAMLAAEAHPPMAPRSAA